jgi:FKBP-type peptidyl-prolyl cis-trans isomerase
MTRISSHLFFFLIMILSGILLFDSCREISTEHKGNDKKGYKESLMKVNKNLVKTEEQKIEDFIHRYKWQMKKTGTGLRYMIYHEGNGVKTEKDNIVVISFTVSLLNGDVCYTSKEEGLNEFKIGKGGVVSGLEEGILLMKKGDRAKFIIPSHLAFGLLGDMNKIPAKAVLVYDVELLIINY